MLSFADAKRIIKVVEINHGEESKFIDLFTELFTMLEESTAEQVIDLQQDVETWKERAADIEQARQSLQVELDELNKAYHDSVNALQKATHTIMDLEEADKATNPQVGKRRGRPKKNPEDAKAETYESDLDDINDKFGVHAFAQELLRGDD